MNCYWFIEAFKSGDNLTQDVIIRLARAYIMLLFSGLLFLDKSRFKVHLKWLSLLRDFRYVRSLSWGLAVLAVLQQNLCCAINSQVVDIAGCLALLQSWI